MFDSFLSDMAGELRLFVIIAICAGLGASGYFIRTGIDRGENQRIWIPIIVWVLLYGVIFSVYPNSFPGALLLLIFPVLGFFGVLIIPDD